MQYHAGCSAGTMRPCKVAWDAFSQLPTLKASASSDQAYILTATQLNGQKQQWILSIGSDEQTL